MRGIYIHDIDFKLNPQYSGVKNKIYSQIKAFNRQGVDMDLIYLEDNNIMFNNEYTNQDISRFKIGRVRNNMMFFLVLKYFKEHTKLQTKKYDFIYIRFSMANIGMYKLAKWLYKQGIKIIIEIPTYPYIDELSPSIYNYVLKKIDGKVWNNIKRYVYRVAVTNNVKSINGIKTINIYNGVDIESIPIVKGNKGDTVNLVGVANISKWHGYDRIIKGLRDYYKEYKTSQVHFYIVGNGVEKNNLEKMVKEFSLNEYVHFVGSRIGSELNLIMDKADIGVSSLALFRAGGGHDPIKTKEFIARGIPVILGYEDKLVDMNLPYIMKVNEDDTPVDIDSILEKIKNLHVDSREIREYAVKNLSWDSQIMKIINSIKY